MITRKRWLKTWADMVWQAERGALTPFERTVMLEWHQNNPSHSSDDPGCEWCKQEKADEDEAEADYQARREAGAGKEMRPVDPRA